MFHLNPNFNLKLVCRAPLNRNPNMEVDKVADMEMDMVADMEVNKVADKIADMAKKGTQFGERDNRHAKRRRKMAFNRTTGRSVNL